MSTTRVRIRTFLLVFNGRYFVKKRSYFRIENLTFHEYQEKIMDKIVHGEVEGENTDFKFFSR